LALRAKLGCSISFEEDAGGTTAVIQDNLKLLFKLYFRPLAAMSAIIDEGSLLFGAVAVLAVSVLLNVGAGARLYSAYQALPPAAAAPPPPQQAAQAQTGGKVAAPAADADGEEAPAGRPLPLVGTFGWSLYSFSSTSTLMTLFSLALLYVPATLFVVTLVEPVGSFGVAFRRDYGSLLACTLMAWAAGRLPFALGAVALQSVASRELMFGLWMAGALCFGAFMLVAVRTVFGVRLGPALAVVGTAWMAFLGQAYLAFLASPFLLYWVYIYFSGDIGDVTWSFRARQGFKRYLEAATVNPRDAGAHYQLGLIYQKRRQIPEAVERFGRAVDIDPNEVDAHYQLGCIARQQRRFDEAIRHFEEVVRRDEKHSRHEIWREIGITYLESGSYEHARWALERYVEQRTHDPEGLYHLGVALKHLGNGQAAQEQFERCIEAVDTTPSYRRHEVRRWGKLAREQGPSLS
jgi:hypothetical protein